MVRSAVRQETELCGGWAIHGSPRHEKNRGGSVRSVRTAMVCGNMVNTNLFILNGKNRRTQLAAKKLEAKLFGPFKVVRLVGYGGQSVVLEWPLRWRVNNVFHISLLEPDGTSVRGLWDKHIAVTDSEYVDRHGVIHEVGYNVEGNQVLEDFDVEEIMGSDDKARRKMVLYLI